jgi:hypothetical protein
VAGALIVTAEMGAADFAWLEALRRAHYPRERNQLPAHMTMFHALPPSAEVEIRRRLADLANAPPPRARIEGLIDLGGGVAFRIFSTDLERIRDELAQQLHGLLGAQDAGGWRPHVTIQNKVAPKVSQALIEVVDRDFTPRPLSIHGLSLHRYLGRPWERIATYPFRGA